MRRAAIVLCGGQSRRMGRDKGGLPFGPGETLLSTVVGRVAEALAGGPVVCVAAESQPLPPLPGACRVVRDRSPERGPLEALATGLRSLRGAADAVLATGCDTPLLGAPVAELLFQTLGDAQAAAPVIESYRQPLPAVYRVDAAGVADGLLDAGRGSLRSLLERLSLAEVSESGLRAVDPGLESLLNCNDPETYRHALALAGHTPPPDSPPPPS